MSSKSESFLFAAILVKRGRGEHKDTLRCTTVLTNDCSGREWRESLFGVREQAALLLHHLKGEEEKLMTRALFVETRHPPEMWIDVEQCADSTESRQLSAHTRLRHVDGNRASRRPSTAAASHQATAD
ncbi:hypothetical protein EYF80_005502 [Liparis tanakae]|uniref:Uncharacterized protein n=1 Tax=Liparis tanakae TaxID=230148 RepID=A0A4Z2J1H7_9TELE|nr:hypothetical protein EYF80_005502 [Liparis tanakae]